MTRRRPWSSRRSNAAPALTTSGACAFRRIWSKTLSMAPASPSSLHGRDAKVQLRGRAAIGSTLVPVAPRCRPWIWTRIFTGRRRWRIYSHFTRLADTLAQHILVHPLLRCHRCARYLRTRRQHRLLPDAWHTEAGGHQFHHRRACRSDRRHVRPGWPGAAGKFAEKPFCKAHISPIISPMRYGEDAFDVAMACIRPGHADQLRSSRRCLVRLRRRRSTVCWRPRLPRPWRRW